MRGRFVFGMVVVTSCMAAVLACNLLTGVSDLETEGAEAAPSDTPEGAAPRADAGPDNDVPPPTCACVTAPPADWNGPIALLESTRDTRACPTGLTAILDGGNTPSTAAPCSPCTCGPPVGSCATVFLETNGDNLCANNCDSKSVGTTCSNIKYCSPTSSAAAVGAADSGTCTPDGGRPNPPAWTVNASACAFAPGARPDTTCPAGQACAPKSLGAPDARTCILHAGDVPCPPGPYAQRGVYDTGFVDTRACGACTCDRASGTCTAGTVTVYTDPGCGNKAKDIPTTGACTTFNDPAPNGSAKITVLPQLLDAGCAPHGGQLVDGGLAGKSPTTACCL